MEQFLEQLINALVLGGIYALIAVGYTMVYGIIELINFAHGEIFMLGAYLAFALVTVFGLPFWIAVPASMLLCAGIGMLMDLVAYRPLRNAPRLSALITAIGVSIGLQNLARIIWGARQRPFPSESLPTFLRQGIPPTESLPAFSLTETAIALPCGASLPYRVCSSMLLALVLRSALTRLVCRTKVGKGMLAGAQKRVCANLMGMHTKRGIVVTFGVGSG